MRGTYVAESHWSDDPQVIVVTNVLTNSIIWTEEWQRLRPHKDCRGIPARVLPLGFALNTLLAAGVLLGVTETIGLARRRLRSRKGLCPPCGYDRRGLHVEAACPECGTER
jgi:hypothetical protein